MSSNSNTDAKDRLVYGKDDVLFGSIEDAQEGRPFGSILDAGTGLHSLRWMGTLQSKGMTRFTAITADETMQRNVQREADALGMTENGEVLIGNWFDVGSKQAQAPLQLQNQQFDTILLDYLIGAMDGFSPYKQDKMIAKLVDYLKPGGRLYIVGLQPIPDTAPNSNANIICKVRQVRDACILLAGHRCYREYPVDWVERQIEQLDTLDLVQPSRKFPILYRHATIAKQIQVARSKLSLFGNEELAQSMGKVLDDLDRQCLEATQSAPNGKIQLGFDYIVTAEKRT